MAHFIFIFFQNTNIFDIIKQFSIKQKRINDFEIIYPLREFKQNESTPNIIKIFVIVYNKTEKIICQVFFFENIKNIDIDLFYKK